ncbi:MAG: glycosyltransferase, partial [Candidatus Omnitrophica bacterium]|nr:glycosyltransferase [Candidatus Omnitrophota bacterium]
MFDVFEGINGCRNPYFNYSWMEGLQNLTPKMINQLYRKHGIEPMSADPWVKGFTGGSDDHAGLFIGKTYTDTEARTKEEFLQNLRDQKTMARGRNNDYKGSAFVFYKIIQDHRDTQDDKGRNKLLSLINKIVFQGKGLSFKENYGIHRLKIGGKKKERIMARFIERLDQDIVQGPPVDMEERVNIVYDNLCVLCDDYVKMIIKKVEKDIEQGNMFKALNHLTSIMPLSYVTLPFMSTWGHLNKDRTLLEDFRRKYIKNKSAKNKKVCWFTDTLLDLNGVSVTINNMHREARACDIPLIVVTSNPKLPVSEMPNQNIINLPTQHSFTPGFYKDYTMNFPSLLKSLEAIERVHPDEIVISTPGPMGLIGLLISKILSIPCTGIYHSDFGAQLNFILGDGYSPMLISKFNNWFFGQMDTISVPTKEYINILKEKGMDHKKMKVFKRGIDSEFFHFDLSKESDIRSKYNLKEGFTLIYAGRVSKDKNLDFLADIYKKVSESRNDVNLIIAGKGPYLEDLKKLFKDYPRVIFTGQVTRQELAGLYSLSDLLIFPSTTDTFGMVVLEAHSCGLPALVSDKGGPQEIISEKTGAVLSVNSVTPWVDKVFEYMDLIRFKPEEYVLIRSEARRIVEEQYSMEAALKDLIGIPANQTLGQEPDVDDKSIMPVIKRTNRIKAAE